MSSKEPKQLTIPEGLTVTFTEKKTKRVQLVMRPSLYEKAKSQADSLNISLNEYINALINAAIEAQESTQ